MPIYRVQAPDGTIIKLEGPEGASQDEVMRQAQALYAQQQQSKPKASLSATELAPGVPIPGMPSAPKLNMQYQGPAAITDTLARNIYEPKKYTNEQIVKSVEDKFANDLGEQTFRKGVGQVKNASSGNDVAMGLSNMARGGFEAYTPLALIGLGGAYATTPGLWNKAKLTGQLAAGMGAGLGAQWGVEEGLKKLGVGDGYAQASGDVAGLAVPAGLMKLYNWAVGKAPTVNPIIENKNTPQRQEQIDLLKRMGVQLDKGQENNSRVARMVGQNLQVVPGASGTAEDFYAAQKQQMAAAAQKLSNAGVSQNAPLAGNNASPEAYPTGQALLDKLNSRITSAKSYADKMYDSVRAAAARNTKQVQVGTRELPASTILDEFGNPALPARTVPVMGTLETPVDLGKIRPQLQSVYEDLARSLTPVQQQSNPAFNALKSLMESGQTQMPAVEYDKFLGAVKAITRDGSSPFLTDKSQGLAKQIIKASEAELAKAFSAAGPNVTAKLSRGRAAVKGYYETADFLSGLRYDEPAGLYSQLVTGGDKVANALKTAQKYAPTEVNQIGKTFLQGLFDKATQGGGFNREAGLLADWNKMGAETKRILFGKQAGEIEKFLLAAKDIGTVYNPSGTAQANKILQLLTGGGLLSAAVNPAALPAEAALTGVGYVGAGKLADALLNPANKSLTSAYDLSKILRSPLPVSSYYKTGAPTLPIVLRSASQR